MNEWFLIAFRSQTLNPIAWLTSYHEVKRLPRSLTQQHDCNWLTKITWNSTRHPSIGRKNKSLRASSSAAKKSKSKKSWKLLACLGCLLRSFNKDSSAGKSSFGEVIVNCVLAVWASNRERYSLCEKLYKDFFKLASMELSTYTLNNFNRPKKPDLPMKIKTFNESHSHSGEVAVVIAYTGRWLLLD